jgi:cytochrome c peroxidase
MLRASASAATIGSALLLGGCTFTDSKPAARLSALPPVVSPADDSTTPDKVTLGKWLFVDSRISGSGRTQCQSCHFRQYGWTDRQVLSRRDDGALNTRHTPGLYNVGHQTIWYWDGRAPTLEAQILAAWRAQSGADPAKIVALLNAIPGYREQFQRAFGGPATIENVPRALAAYLRTKNSDNSPWDRYETGDAAAVGAEAVAGFNLFMGKGRCVACHTPPHYGNSTFFNIGLEHGKPNPDPGRFNVTKNEADRGAFKTPSLRSVALTAPYFHDGSRATLEEAVRYMAGGGNPDPNKSPVMQPTGLTDAEIGQVVAFLRTLTSEEVWTPPLSLP